MRENNEHQKQQNIIMNDRQREHLVRFQKSIRNWIHEMSAPMKIKKCFQALKRHEKNIILQVWEIDEFDLNIRLMNKAYLTYFMEEESLENATYTNFLKNRLLKKEVYHGKGLTNKAEAFLGDWAALNHFRVEMECKEGDYMGFSHPQVVKLWDRLSEKDKKSLYQKWEVKNYEEAVKLYDN